MDSLEDMDEDHLLTTAIIGGGYAGMAAAVTLAENNIPVTVFESAKQLGGRARAVVQNATQLDNGQHILTGQPGPSRPSLGGAHHRQAWP